MAEKPKDKKGDKKKPAPHHSSGGMSFEVEVIIFIVILFIVWAIFGKRSENVDKPFIQTNTTTFVPQQ